MRYFMFIDESGEANINNPDPRFNIFVLCAIVFNEHSYKQFNQRFIELKEKHFGNSDVIFHSVEMRKKANVFKIFLDNDVLSSFYDDIGNIFRNSDYTVLSCVVNKDKYKERYPYRNHAYEDALKFICERGISFIKTPQRDNTLHLCLEKRGKGKDRYLKTHYTQFIKYGTPYYSTWDFKLCDKNLYFRGKEENINGLQFADLCAYPIARKHLSPENPQPTFDIFENKIFRKFGKVIGYGIKHFP